MATRSPTAMATSSPTAMATASPSASTTIPDTGIWLSGSCNTVCGQYAYCLTEAADANCNSAPRFCSTDCTACPTGPNVASATSIPDSIPPCGVYVLGYCSTVCTAYAYCSTAPDADCANAA